MMIFCYFFLCLLKILLTCLVFIRPSENENLLLWFKLVIAFDFIEILRIVKIITYFREKIQKPKKGLQELLKYLEKYRRNDFFLGNIFREANLTLKWTTRINTLNKM